jgi:hypothetical protein
MGSGKNGRKNWRTNTQRMDTSGDTKDHRREVNKESKN